MFTTSTCPATKSAMLSALMDANQEADLFLYHDYECRGHAEKAAEAEVRFTAAAIEVVRNADDYAAALYGFTLNRLYDLMHGLDEAEDETDEAELDLCSEWLDRLSQTVDTKPFHPFDIAPDEDDSGLPF